MPSSTPANSNQAEGNGPWLWYVAPLIIFGIVTSLEPAPGAPGPLSYPVVYCLKILATVVAIYFAAPTLRQYPFKVSWLSVAVGVVGVALWVSITNLGLEPKLLGPLGWSGAASRAAFNPIDGLKDTPLWRAAFLAVRFFGLAVAVPIIEELFYRGFVLRYATQRDWWTLPFGQGSTLGLAACTLLPVVSHPAEIFAALVWFSLVTWLMLRTRSLWDCIVAHGVTNLLLGIYVLSTGDWKFW